MAPGGLLSFEVDIAELERELPDWAANRIPSITRNALNDTADDARFAELQRIRGVFDRPTPFTAERAVEFPGAKRATKEHLVATINVRDTAGGGGNAPEKYLRAEIEGGGRAPKRFEVALRRMGLLAPNEFATIAIGYPRDAYGNLPGTLYVRMLSQLKAFAEVGFKANETARSKKRAGTKRARFFVPKASFRSEAGLGGLRRGVYERVGPRGKPRAVLIFVRAPRYRVRYRFGEAALTKANRVFAGYFERYFYREVAKRTARQLAQLQKET